MRIKKPQAILAIALITCVTVVAACGSADSTSPEQVDCKTVQVNSNPYCVYGKSIGGTRYQCPERLSTAKKLGKGTVCTDRAKIPEEDRSDLKNEIKKRRENNGQKAGRLSSVSIATNLNEIENGKYQGRIDPGETSKQVQFELSVEYNEPADADFEGESSNGSKPPLEYSWDFGVQDTEDDTSDEKSPSYEYSNPGDYEVTVTVQENLPESSDKTPRSASDTVQIRLVEGEPQARSLAVEATADPREGSAPLEVKFMAQASLGTGRRVPDDLELDFEWAFGDGTTSSEKHPRHTYEEAGEYTAKLTVSEAGPNAKLGPVSTEVTIEVGAPEFEVEIEASKTEARVGETIEFVCKQDPAIEGSTFEWTDDASSKAASGKTYKTTFQFAGTYNVSCTVTGPDGEQQNRASVTVTVTEDPKPEIIALNATPRTGIAPLEVSFSATVSYSGEDELSYKWDFGNGTVSNEKSPTFKFNAPRIHTVSLTVTDADGDTALDTVDIEVIEDGPVAVSISEPANDTVSGIAPFQVDFDASTSGVNKPISIEWDFGDGDTSTRRNPTHTFTNAQNSPYTVQVTATDKNGDVASDTVTVEVEEDLSTSAEATIDQANTESDLTAPRQVGFKCTANGGNAPFSFSWDFGDGNTKDLGQAQNGNTSHTYADPDAQGGSPFTAECTVTDADGDTASATTGPIEVQEP